MTRLIRSIAALALIIPAVASAQPSRVWVSPDRSDRVTVFTNGNRPMIGVVTTIESEREDTLGLRIEEVRRGGPAERAGIKPGDRIQRAGGVSLRADRADAGEEDYDGVLNRRLVREIEKIEDGKAIELVVLSEGRTRTVSVTPVKAEEMYESSGGYAWSSAGNDRAVIGISTGASGSPRDTLGVFVASVTTDGPADKAGIIEGDRIASINGVNLRVSREDVGDAQVSSARASRLSRELARLDAGATVELVIVSAGRSRTVRVTTVKASDLPGTATWSGVMPLLERVPMPPSAPRALMPSVAPTPPTPPTPRAGTVRLKSRVISL